MIAVCDDPYAIQQDVATACRLIKGELWYDTTKGIPYFDTILGHKPAASYLSAALSAAALTVPGVLSASVSFDTNGVTDKKTRTTSGLIEYVDIYKNTNRLAIK